MTMQKIIDEEQADSGSESRRGASTTAHLDDKPHHLQNFLILAAHHIFLRCGWIFKTESIIMPAVIEALGGSAWLRGCLPLLNRFGQSIPPMLMSRRIKVMPQKKWAMLVCVSSMSVCFLSLSVIWFMTGEQKRWWMAPAFLAIYGVFFVSTGIYNMTFTTVQGKLIRINRRGRLLLVSNIVGAVFAITAAGLLLPLWLQPDEEQFRWVFGFAGVMFALSALVSIFLLEPRDAYSQAPRLPTQLLKDAVSVLGKDHGFRRLAIIGFLFGSCLTLFPHYQSIGRALSPDEGFRVLISWVMVQNAGTACASLVAGPLADRFGNRLALRVLLLLMCVAPFMALTLRELGPAWRLYYNIVFILVGLTPTVFRILNNYTLELATASEHPRYLSTLSLCIAAPAVSSPLVGLLIDQFGFVPVFVAIGSVLFAAWILTITLHEPRHADGKAV